MHRLLRPVAALLLLLLAFAPAHARGYLWLHDEATGQTREIHEDAHHYFRVTSDGRVRAEVGVQSLVSSFWWLDFVAPPGQSLQPGLYPDVSCIRKVSGRSAAMEITDNNPTCTYRDTVWGWFAVRQLGRDRDGTPVVEIAFSQRRGAADAPALSGVFRYNAMPLSFNVLAARGSPWGAVRQDNHGDTSFFALHDGGDGTLRYSANVIKDDWVVHLAAPLGRRLLPGIYKTRAQASAEFAGLVTVRNETRACNDPHGVLEVVDVQRDAGERVVALHARYQLRCGTSSQALHGEIRYHL